MTGAPPRRFRFAPTPSRPLHVGSALAALVGWGAARAAGGTLVLRVEDIDVARCRPEFEATLLEDLRWLGLDWDEGPDVGGPFGPYRQSARFERYDAWLEALARRGRAYPCTCSRAEVRAAQSAPHLHAGGEVPYPGTCRPGPGEAPRALHVDRGGYRLDVTAEGERARVVWDDLWCGRHVEDVRLTCGDFLLGRPGAPTYQLAVVADDGAMGITDVVRGRDLLGSTARQLLLHEALGQPAPRFGHHPLVTDEGGRKLSKREGDLALATFREAGDHPGELIARLGASVGMWSPAIRRADPGDFAEVLRGVPAWHDGPLLPRVP